MLVPAFGLTECFWPQSGTWAEAAWLLEAALPP